MASPKRQRQEQMRALRRQELEQQRHKEKRNAKLRRYLIIGGIVVAIVGLLWFTSRDNGDDTPVTTTTAAPTTTAGASTTAPPNTIAGLGEKPDVTVPDGAAPTTLQSTDLVVGTGAEAKTGSTVSVQYVGKAWSDKTEFDSSWDRGKQPFSVVLGQGNVIKGWDEGLVGMKVGGRRQLVIPAEMAYGASGQGSIKPNETLVFVVDLLSVS